MTGEIPGWYSKLLHEVMEEVKAAHAKHDRPFPASDPVRSAALLAEECGEAAAEALALTRPGADVVSLRAALRAEVLHCAATCFMWLEGMDDGRRKE